MIHNMIRFMSCLVIPGFLLANYTWAEVIINEIHYDPDDQTEWVEFVELHNSGPEAADLSGWYFSSGIEYQFPAGTSLSANGYLVVAQNKEAVQNRFRVTSSRVYGPFVGRLITMERASTPQCKRSRVDGGIPLVFWLPPGISFQKPAAATPFRAGPS